MRKNKLTIAGTFVLLSGMIFYIAYFMLRQALIEYKGSVIPLVFALLFLSAVMYLYTQTEEKSRYQQIIVPTKDGKEKRIETDMHMPSESESTLGCVAMLWIVFTMTVIAIYLLTK